MKKTMRMMATVAFIFLVPLGLLAQTATPSEGYYAGSFARLNFVSGEVFVQRTADQGTVSAEVNLALVQGDKLGTGAGQAEVQFGGRNYLRLDNNSKVEFVALPTEGQNLIKIHVLEGSAYLRVGSLAGEKAIEVHSPDASFYILEEGLYRFNVDPNAQTEVLVHEGSLEAAGEEGSVVVKAGESVTASDGRLLGEPAYFQAGDDAFDQWNQSRDGLEAQRSTTRYLPSDIEEYQEELDANGSWAYEQPYGYVWVPYGVGADWRPYMHGHWTWYPLCGWTWVSAEPWGWPVYHYGRWHWRGGLGWYWIPQHYWGPAWVHWWSDRDYVGWCPLSWYNRPVVVVGNQFYDRYHDRYFPGHNRAMSVIHRDQLQGHDISRHMLGQDQVGRFDHIDLRAEQPGFRPSVGRSNLQSPEAQRIFSGRPGMRSQAKNYPSGSGVSSSRLRSPAAAGPGRGSNTLRSGDRPSTVPDRTMRDGSMPSRGASSGRDVRVYPSQSSGASARGGSPVQGRDRADGASRSPRSSGDGAARVYPSRQDGAGAAKADAPRSDGSRSASPPRSERSDSGAKVKTADPVKHYPSASIGSSSARDPRASSASRPETFASSRVNPSRRSDPGRATTEYSSRLSAGGRASRSLSRPDRPSSGAVAGSGRTSSFARTDRAPDVSSRSRVSQTPRYDPRTYSYSGPSSSSRSASPTWSGSSRASGRSAQSGPSARSFSAPRSSAPSGSRSSYSAPSRASGSSGQSSRASSSSVSRSSSSSPRSSSSSSKSSSSGHSNPRKKG